MLKRIFRVIKATVLISPMEVILNLIYMVIIASFTVLMSYTSKMMVEIIRMRTEIGSWMVILLPALLYYLSITVAGNYSNFEDMMILRYSRKLEKRLKSSFLKKSYKTSQDFFYETEFFNTYDFVKNNINRCPEISVEILNRLVLAVASILMICGLIMKMSMIILLVVLLLGWINGFSNIMFSRRQFNLNEKLSSVFRRSDYYEDILSKRGGAKEVRMLFIGERVLNKWKKTFTEGIEERISFEVREKLSIQGIEFVRKLCIYGLAFFYIIEVYRGKLTEGDVAFLSSTVPLLNMRIKNTIDIFTRGLNEKEKYCSRYEEFVGEIGVEEKLEDSRSKKRSLGDFESIELINVSYRYRNREHRALKDINLRIKRGEKISILGYNGSGKSTLSKIICGTLDEFEGDVRYNGESIRDIHEEEYWKKFGVGFQEFSRYALSLRENIAIGCIERMDDEEALDKAFKKAKIESISEALHNREETILGKEYSGEGQELSGGQWQKVSLARAYIGEKDVLILDEPTAAIDPLEEKRMLNMFNEMTRDKTAIFISHRVGFAKMCDRIVLMKDGRITEEGNHEELLRLRGEYYELFTAQQELYKEVV